MMTNSAVLLGADRNEAIKELRKVLNFEIELAMVRMFFLKLVLLIMT